MGAFLGLVLGVGLVLIWWSGPRRRPPRHPPGRPVADRLAELLTQAGYPGISPNRLLALSAALGGGGFVLVAGVSGSAPIGLAFAGFAGYAPLALVRARRRHRRVELRELWPEVVDNLASAVRAGLSLPEALSALATRGPEPLRPTFARFGEDYRATGRFGDSLDRLKAALADPVADRIVESLRMAREVGGSDLGRLLRTLAQFLREDVRTRAEIETRQGWTVNAARLALAAPWLVLGLFSLRPEAVRAYNSPSGVVVLAVGGGVSLIAYRLMMRIGRLPIEDRVLR
ncbi:MAG TPA: type II secretion system F family protein [Mycobacteriales bacterium]|nr:type II secretion system F family protein [Mycobacteriales bacterium]